MILTKNAEFSHLIFELKHDFWGRKVLFQTMQLGQ